MHGEGEHARARVGGGTPRRAGARRSGALHARGRRGRRSGRGGRRGGRRGRGAGGGRGAEERRVVRVHLRGSGDRAQGAEGWSVSSSCAVLLWICYHSAHHHCQGCNITSNKEAGRINSGHAEFTATDQGNPAEICRQSGKDTTRDCSAI
uniref:Uncharacterized protein n=1 Tax=Arundo donax TaxID=35708 RepID=A0A0A9F9P5_ARUDO